jgi:hypothetical protein
MAKRIQESIGEYVDWLINLNYDKLEKQGRESVSMSEEKRASTEQRLGQINLHEQSLTYIGDTAGSTRRSIVRGSEAHARDCIKRNLLA